ncbi:flagellar hook-associated protein FlgL [Paraburkholderia jirisanensis]
MRIASSLIFQNTIQSMDNQQSTLAQLQQEISTNKKLLTPADDPLGAAQAVQLSQSGAALSQYSSNQTAATASLGIEDQTLTSVSGVLTQINTLLTSINNGTLNDANRQAQAKQLQGLRDTLLSLANTTDSSGNHIFSGFQGGTAPFTNQSNGGVTYNGDTGAQQVQIADSTTIQTSDSGASVFMSVLSGVAQPVPASAATNTGTGTFPNSPAVTITQAGVPGNNDSYSITFGTDATGAPTYSVNDTSTSPATSISTNQPYTAGQPITLSSGMSVAISGTPAAGDSFTVTPAAQGNTDVFSTIDSVISALQQPVDGNQAATATLSNAVTKAATELGNSMSNVSTVQASVGGREQQLKAMISINSNETTQTKNNMANVVNVDPATVLSQFVLVQNALTAAQKTFAAASSLSLFQVINP